MFGNYKDLVIVAVEIIDSCDIRMLNAGKKTRLLVQNVGAVAFSDINKLKVRSFPPCNHVLSKVTNVVIVVPRIPKKDPKNSMDRFRWDRPCQSRMDTS